jgi:hypothetical protein
MVHMAFVVDKMAVEQDFFSDDCQLPMPIILQPLLLGLEQLGGRCLSVWRLHGNQIEY